METAHEIYLKVFDVVRLENQELAQMFDGITRSKATVKIFLMRRAGLFTEAEWAGFSEEIRRVYAGD